MMDNMQPDEIIYNSCPPSPPATSSPPPPTPMYPPWPPTLPPSPVASAGEQIASWALGFAIALGVTIICTVVPKYLVGPLPEGSGVDKDGKPWTAATLHAEHKLYLMEPVTVTCAELPKLAKKEGIGQSRTIYERVKVYFLLPLAVLLAVIDVIMSVANFELSTGSATGNAWDAVNYYMTAFLLMDVYVMLQTVPRKDDGSLDLTAIRVCDHPAGPLPNGLFLRLRALLAIGVSRHYWAYTLVELEAHGASCFIYAGSCTWFCPIFLARWFCRLE